MTRCACGALAALGVALLTAGCQTSTCDRGEDATLVRTGDGRTGTNTWFSSPYYDPSMPRSKGDTGYEYLPPARTITFQHGLGSLPIVAITLAFNDNGSLAPTAGNQAIIECMDDQVVQIKNDTCSDFYIWVQAQGSGISAKTACKNTLLDPAGAGGAAADPSSGAAGAEP
ncbi:MAG: hypothetical protein ABI488_16315 [Polyangiaceae bacterium]